MTTEQAALFDGFDPPEDPDAQLSAGRRLTLRQRAAVEAGIHPLTKTKTRPDLGTCGDCALRTLRFGRFPKCTLGAQLDRPPYRSGPYMSHGQATDCRAWWPACDQHQPRGES